MKGTIFAAYLALLILAVTAFCLVWRGSGEEEAQPESTAGPFPSVSPTSEMGPAASPSPAPSPAPTTEPAAALPAAQAAPERLLVKCGGKKVYITADATPDAERHRMVLAGRRCDAAFWNGLHLSYVETRTLMREAAEKNYVYHVPVDPADTSGIRRKCERNMQRFASELAGVVVLDRYPAVLCQDAREGESTRS